jgi:hypothetical protein
MSLETGISRNEIVAVGTTSVSVSREKKRKVLYVRNTSTAGQTITLTFSNNQPAVASAGVVLGTNDFIIDSQSENYRPWWGVVSAISSAASGQLSVYEVAY